MDQIQLVPLVRPGTITRLLTAEGVPRPELLCSVVDGYHVTKYCTKIYRVLLFLCLLRLVMQAMLYLHLRISWKTMMGMAKFKVFLERYDLLILLVTNSPSA